MNETRAGQGSVPILIGWPGFGAHFNWLAISAFEPMQFYAGQNCDDMQWVLQLLRGCKLFDCRMKAIELIMTKQTYAGRTDIQDRS